MGWWSAASSLLSGNNSADFFLIFWLGGWSVGGIFAIWFLYRLLRPSILETLLLKNRSVEYDSGVPPFQLTFGFVTPSDYWKQFFPKRQQIEIGARELDSLAVREHSTGNRLTLDYGNQRLEIARGSTEIEREWLYKELERKYS